MKLHYITAATTVLCILGTFQCTYPMQTMPTVIKTATLAGPIVRCMGFALALEGLYPFCRELIGYYEPGERMTRADMIRCPGMENIFLLDAICAGDESDIRHAVLSGAGVNSIAVRHTYASRIMWNTFYNRSFQRFFAERINHNPFTAQYGYSFYWCSTTPLTCAARLGNSKIISLLLELGASIDHQHHGVTALHNAAYFGQPEAVETLLNAGSDPNLTDNRGHTALTVAACMQQTEIIQILLQYGTTVPTDMQLEQLNLDSKSCTLIKEQAHLAVQCSALIEQQCMKQHPNFSHDLASLTRSFATSVKSITTATNQAAESERDNTNIIDSLLEDALSIAL